MNKQVQNTPLRRLDAPARMPVPDYLSRLYWWAYVHPRAVSFFERQWLVNLILWGNFSRLRNSVLDELGSEVTGNTLQIACVYGDFTPSLEQRLAADARLDVVDVLPIQLQNLDEKLGQTRNVRLYCANAEKLDFANTGSYDQVVLFFLLHELPQTTREKTLQEAFRVLKPGGKLVIVDYHKPSPWNPLRYLMRPLLAWLEPYALALWKHELTEFMPDSVSAYSISKRRFFAGLYQLLVIEHHP
jgi:ubiquinone/menaquinone biosynthesis C-methylase UbiE